MWQNYANAVLGLCVLFVSFLGLEGAALGWTLGILGAAITVLGLWGAGITQTSAGGEVRHA